MSESGSQFPAQAYCTLWAVDEDGASGGVNLTARGDDPTAVLDSLFEAIAHGETLYGLKLKVGATTKPKQYAQSSQGGELTRVPIDDSGQELQSFPVEEVALAYSKNGKPYLAAFGGWFRQFGLAGWPEKLPPEVREEFESWGVGKRRPAPEGMKTVFVLDKKAVRFE